jgi:large subunit ribosomal protein L34
MEKFVTLKKKRRIRKHGFFARMSTHKGRIVLKRRRAKNRKNLSL